ncbi:MAG: aminopeptidase [Candidatus Methanomethylophilaceae archaeon]
MGKTKGQELESKLLSKQKNIGEEDSSILGRSIEFCEGYKKFLTNKTEREVVEYTIPLLKSKGYTEYVRGTEYPAGSKIFFNNRGKNLVMMTIGSKDISEGFRMGASHIDSPRLDFKPNPLFEDADMAYFKTHYYGGIKKYQWSTVPLSLHGVVSLRDGSKVMVNIGEDDDDPSFCVTDLLPHLAKEQMKKPATEVLLGEQLNILIGCWPYSDKEVTQKVKLNVANILFEKYGIVEKDFLSAELCAVPAVTPKDLGMDRAMVGGYGQDDSVCAYASLIAELDSKNPAYTTVTVFADKEETGSDGNTGMGSCFLRDFLEDFVSAYGLEIRHVLEKSVCLSCDVNAAFDPAFSDVFEKNNASYLNHGAVVSKYTGGGGKYSTNDASAETMRLVGDILDDANVTWQVGELGKVDIGGGGTIAMYLSAHNIDTVDVGVPVLSMHSPFEVVSKADVYMMYLAVHAFYNSTLRK